MDGKKPLTYSGDEFAEFLNLADPRVIPLERLVPSLRDASAGVERARQVCRQFVHYVITVRGQREGADPDGLFDALWHGDMAGEDLADLALEQASDYRVQAFDWETSPCHPDLVARPVRELTGVAEALEEFARRPRRDELEAQAEAHRRESWPRRLTYEQKHGAKNARIFLTHRPARVLSHEGCLYSLEGSVWTRTGDDALAAEVRGTDPANFLDVPQVRNLVAAVHHATATAARPFEWLEPGADDPAPEDLALFRNGLLDVERGRLIRHDGRYFATGLPDFDHDPLAGCPAWTAWLEETLEPCFHDTLQEWFGYCMTPDTRAQRFAMLVGGPRTGKSTAQGVLARLVGPQHSASTTLQDLAGEFGLEPLMDKRLAIVPDAHDAPRGRHGSAIERIKSFVGEDAVSVNRKGQPIVTARLRTRLLLTCNRPPKFLDESGALAKRMLIVRFGNSFEGREDRSLSERLAAELPGIANWALEGLLRLRSNGMRFTVSEAGAEEQRDATRSQSPARRFAEERLVVTGDDWDATPMSDVRAAYDLWCIGEGLQHAERRSQNDLAADLRAAFPELGHRQRRVGGKQTYCLIGASLATDGGDARPE